MNEPRRTRDDPGAPAELRALFRGAQRTRPMGEERRRRLGERIAVIAAMPLAASLLATTLKAMAAGAIVSVVGATVVLIAMRGEESDAVRGASRRAALTATATEAEAATATATATEAEVAMAAIPAEPEVAAPEAASPVRPSPRRAGGVEAAPVDELAMETAMLQRAQSLLATDPAHALASTREHARRFPRGQMAAEREVLAAQALLAMGDTRAAHLRARRVLRDHPSSLAASRARAMLDAP